MPSKGEQKVASLLAAAGIAYKTEVSLPGLKGFKKRPLRFDFIVYKNNQIVCILEIDGKQHFEWVKRFQKTIFDFRQTQERDRIKNAFCLKNRIPLIRIPYWALDNLTLTDIFTNPSYRVVNKYHNDLLLRR